MVSEAFVVQFWERNPCASGKVCKHEKKNLLDNKSEEKKDDLPKCEQLN
jgi:hypothetical protein